MTTAVIKARNPVKRAGTVSAIDHPDFDLCSGETPLPIRNLAQPMER